MYEPYLAHYGVKGMKWGVRKSSAPSAGSRNISRRQNRKMNRSASKKFYQNKANTIIKEVASRQSDVMLFDARRNKLMSGTEFVHRLQLTDGVFNAKYTDIVATRGSAGEWEAYSGPGDGRYKKQDFRKQDSRE